MNDNSLKIMQELITNTTVWLAYNTIKLGVDPSGIKPSEKIINFNGIEELEQALEEAQTWVKTNS